MNILVVGGAGYIGSHMVKLLGSERFEVSTLDNLSEGYEDAVLAGRFIKGDFGDAEFIDQLFSENKFDAVMHFASSIQVGESVTNPAKYYKNNVTNTQTLLDCMVKHGVLSFIFSSTAAVFGEPAYSPIDEAHINLPINPYGRSKYMVEQILEDYDHAYGLKSVCLRYFNAAGADPEGELGERHLPETHLIPLILQAASGRRDAISIFGDDYDTPDGSCVRDYIHISDLADAHLLALKGLLDGGSSAKYNLGNGDGFSVIEVIEAVRKVTGKDFAVKHEARRDGDSARLIADSSLAKSVLGWRPQYADLEVIIEHAWQWEQKF
jgi:UDP-glucose 4-epimerase|tara:strand:- start:3031 stop:3999 length:969 start_codon:yes stop_codon:yes gene_type:complete